MSSESEMNRMNAGNNRDKAIAIIKQEHQNISRVLKGLAHVAKELEERYVEPDFRLLSSMLYYLDSFPDEAHHLKEDEHLFKAIRKRTPKAKTTLDELQLQHIEAAVNMLDLHRTLVHYQGGKSNGARLFAYAVNKYMDFQWKHMEKEESVILPLAQQVLTEADWEIIAQAFSENDDPLFGLKPRQELRKLLIYLDNIAPQNLKSTSQFDKTKTATPPFLPEL